MFKNVLIALLMLALTASVNSQGNGYVSQVKPPPTIRSFSVLVAGTNTHVRVDSWTEDRVKCTMASNTGSYGQQPSVSCVYVN